ncbi:MAG: hypothetical protein KBT33_11145, partial [Prevotellaceae bacterium]|nr:hypothetical protein [Candidatus Minthosoma equi]
INLPVKINFVHILFGCKINTFTGRLQYAIADGYTSSDLWGLFCTFAMRLWAGADFGKRYNIKNKCNNALQNYTNSATLQSWNRDKMHQSYA